MNRKYFIAQTGVALFSFLYASPISGFNFTKPRNILVLGGTSFVGPAVIRAALAAGFNVTMLNRGITNPELFPTVERIKADRLQPLPATIASRKWDAIIDTWPEDPAIVESSARFFKNNTEHYIFISTIAVYANFKDLAINENYPLKKADAFKEGRYAFNKVLCEKAIQDIYPGSNTIVRPGSITGDRDPSDGFRFWTWRIKKGGEIIAPGAGLDLIQYIDVQDVASWIIRCIQKKLKTTFNLTGPPSPLTFEEFLLNAKRILNSSVKIYWADESMLKKFNYNNRKNMPLWNSLQGEAPGFETISSEKAKKMGMHFQTLQQMIQTSLKNYSPDYIFGGSRYGLTIEEENKITEEIKKQDSRIQREQ